MPGEPPSAAAGSSGAALEDWLGAVGEAAGEVELPRANLDAPALAWRGAGRRAGVARGLSCGGCWPAVVVLTVLEEGSGLASHPVEACSEADCACDDRAASRACAAPDLSAPVLAPRFTGWCRAAAAAAGMPSVGTLEAVRGRGAESCSAAGASGAACCALSCSPSRKAATEERSIIMLVREALEAHGDLEAREAREVRGEPELSLWRRWMLRGTCNRKASWSWVR